MNKDSLNIKNEFDTVMDNLIISDNKEKRVSVILINCVFVLAFIFVFISSFMIVRNYYKNVENSNEVKQIVNVKIIETEGTYE